MASIDARVTKLEKQVAALRKQLVKQKADTAALDQKFKNVERWIKADVKWEAEVTAMLREINWKELANDYPYTAQGTGNPPQSPPDWPMSDTKHR